MYKKTGLDAEDKKMAEAQSTSLCLGGWPEVFSEEVACKPIPETSIIKTSTYLTINRDKENRLGKGQANQMQRQGRIRKSSESWSPR